MTITLHNAPFMRRSVETSRPATPMVDPYGRHITYLRLSVTDRCDLRCTYCMAEKMTFLPKMDLLSLEELDRLATAFIAKGVKRLRITGGEPLVRKDILSFIEGMSRHLDNGALSELTLTTNGTQLTRHADRLARAGIRRINVSLDSLDQEKYRSITRGGDLRQVLDGMNAAIEAGIKIKINTVALKQDNADELSGMMAWAHSVGCDFTIIEAMPMGEIDQDRYDQYLPLTKVREQFSENWTFEDDPYRTGGPARYVRVRETGGRLGFISPLSHNFCESCNRVRVTCTGQLYMCLGQEDQTDLLAIMRQFPGDEARLQEAIDEAITRKPKGHDFQIDRRGAEPAVRRHMSVTGG